jgi:hypothetical protein
LHHLVRGRRIRFRRAVSPRHRDPAQYSRGRQDGLGDGRSESNSAELSAAFREQVRTKAANDPAALAMVDNPYFLVSAILFMLFLIFLFVTISSVAGGALGARVIREDRAPGTQPR